MGVTVAGDRAWKVVQMSENVSAAEWLRGIIDEYGVSGTRSCTAIAEAFGIDCKHEKTCRDCITKMMTAIADRIDAERALPEGMEWPRFEDGGLVKMDDEVEFEGKTMRVYLATLNNNRWTLWCEHDGIDGRLIGSYGERVERPAPEVLDADGVPIKVGDTVYCDGEDEPLRVSHITDSIKVTLINSHASYYTVKPSRLTHERPDSWGRIEEDAKLAPRDYLEKRGMNPEKTERIASMMADLVRRAKALAKKVDE